MFRHSGTIRPSASLDMTVFRREAEGAGMGEQAVGLILQRDRLAPLWGLALFLLYGLSSDRS
jgi:hypothetical protein